MRKLVVVDQRLFIWGELEIDVSFEDKFGIQQIAAE